MLATVVLAAGESKRMGKAKLAIKYKGETLLDIALQKATAVTDIGYCVIGAKQEYLKIAEKYELTIVQNPDWQEGISSSLRAAINAQSIEVNAILIVMPDQPFVETAHLEKLIAEYRKNETALIYSKYQGTLGVPAIIPRRLFETVARISGDKGARALINKVDNYSYVELHRSCDIDTPEDLKLLN